jgi:hypothetical protein
MHTIAPDLDVFVFFMALQELPDTTLKPLLAA